MTEKPKLVYDAPKHQHLYEWQVGEHLWVSEPVFDSTREYVEALEAENAKLRELVKRYHHLVNGTDELWSWQSVYEQLRELGIEVDL